MNPYSEAILAEFRLLCDEVLEALEGIPDEDLATWTTNQAHGDISTMYGLATHIAGAGEFWTLQAVGGVELNRKRLEEFSASGSVAAIRERYDDWLNRLEPLLERLTDDDLRSIYVRKANPAQDVSAAEKPRAECLLHALSHTALHLGHLQIQRQLWEQERSA